MVIPQARLGIIGGSGLYQMDGLSQVEEVRVDTPFGPPSDVIVVGTLEGQSVAFLPRHGRGHRHSPTEIPARANIWALKSLGVERLISVSAVGSLKDEIKPSDLVVPDQLIDRTKSRVNSFFEGGIVVHAGFADPFCPQLSQLLFQAAQGVGATVHRGGTYVVMEGPLFSTRAESRLYRSWKANIIGMTALPEAKLAREAEMCYATLACATDYDCWHPTEESVTIERVLAILQNNVARAKEIIKRVAVQLSEERQCLCGAALQNAIITAPELIPDEVKRKYQLLVGKYL
ncbi:MAG: S-methyl-5'-thioadenosine phosphorylase [Chloroflexi bacterium]|nr:S-methyl-5'-thioadenosine phosphorylase [Chloroflexota bacterium]